MARTPYRVKKPKSPGIGRPPVAKKGEKTKEFRVADGYSIGGFDGVRKYEGETVVLTKKQAEHMVKLKAIVIELDDFDVEVEDEPVKEKPAKDKAKASSGRKAEGDGDATSGDDAGQPAL